MKIWLAALLILTASAKSPAAETPQQLMDKAKDFLKKGDPASAKRVYQNLKTKFGDTPLGGGLADDVDLGGAAAVNTYGDFADVELKFIELELTQGKARIFSDPNAALEDILEDIDLNEISELRNKMWVRMHIGQCGTALDENTPDEAMEELRQELEMKGVKVKKYSAGTGHAPTMKIALKSFHHLELRMSRYGKGWVWDHTIICPKAP